MLFPPVIYRGCGCGRLLHDAQLCWARAARTDKGVSALANVVSLKLMAPGGGSALAEALNGVLPAAMRVFDVVPTTKSFEAKVTALLPAPSPPPAPARCVEGQALKRSKFGHAWVYQSFLGIL